MNVFSRKASSGKISGFSASAGSRLREDLLDAVHRADVVHVRLDRRLDLGLVDEVDELLGRVRVRRADRDLHVVGPQHAAALRQHELDVRVVGLELHRVAGPAEDHPGVALGEVLDVLVAGEAADLPGVDALLELVDGLQELVEAGLLGVGALPGSHEADRVAHLGEHRDLALVGRVEQVVDGLRLPLDLVLAVDDPRRCPTATASRTRASGRTAATSAARSGSSFAFGIVDLSNFCT